MSAPIALAVSAAVVIALVAAVSDTRSGVIPNWVSLPPMLVAPVAYSASLGFGYGVQSIIAALTAGVGPYIVFRLRGMGGGDVKLFASLGAVVGFDPMAGLRIQLAALCVALLAAVLGQLLRGRFAATLMSVAASGAEMLLPPRCRRRAADLAKTPVRMGAAILVGTVLTVLPHLEPFLLPG